MCADYLWQRFPSCSEEKLHLATVWSTLLCASSWSLQRSNLECTHQAKQNYSSVHVWTIIIASKHAAHIICYLEWRKSDANTSCNRDENTMRTLRGEAAVLFPILFWEWHENSFVLIREKKNWCHLGWKMTDDTSVYANDDNRFACKHACISKTDESIDSFVITTSESWVEVTMCCHWTKRNTIDAHMLKRLRKPVIQTISFWSSLVTWWYVLQDPRNSVSTYSLCATRQSTIPATDHNQGSCMRL